ncbi:transglutaminase domain-containing protein [Verrucomicrobiaceae bacterium N1E253]|uniref:Transglutaminase domain-containing protein n=1 Tax=Oceaniferula marina TaxID=2748318 RepID=A0A851GQX3_9BACT|nr:transglutaminase-like domain-containing protein [Oceaniferula marina]NWK57210.1 transglutaminase domain-containing protein [Oceaniferula marina]
MPPRLLSGITLLFWGSMTGHPVLGLIAALLLESKSWLTTRWEFGPTTYVRAWHYSVLCATLIAILSWINGTKANQLHSLFIWAPLALLPIELAMRFGTANKIPLNTFSFFARRKMQEDERLGRQVEPRMIHTSYPYLAVTLLATAMGSRSEWHHLAGMSLLIAIALFFNARKAGFRPWAWAVSIGCIIALTSAGQWGMFKLRDYYRSSSAPDHENHHSSADESRTSIGRLGRLKLSSRIFWRMRVHQGPPPPLVRVATYNRYANAVWKYQYLDRDPNAPHDELGYLGQTILPQSDIRVFKDQESAPLPVIEEPAELTMIGEINPRLIDNPLPLPHFTQAIGGIAKLGPESNLDCNTLGTVRLANPEYHVIQYQIWRGKHSTTERAPDKTDLDIPAKEQASIRKISEELKLKELPNTALKIQALRHFFTTEFAYSTHLNTPGLSKRNRRTAISRFLEETRTGHCEYFATATTLLLREAGVPTRYCIGFAADEKDQDEWLMRGLDAHAWCRVWIPSNDSTHGGHWQDLDLTPPSWQHLGEGKRNQWQRKLSDWWQMLSEDFLLWRSEESNRSQVSTIIASLIAVLTLWIAWRLWKSRRPRQSHTAKVYHPPSGVSQTPLNRLEPQLGKILGPRPVGMPLPEWLAQLTEHLPEQSELINKLSESHNHIRFCPDVPSGSPEDQAIDSLCKQLQRQLKSCQKHRKRSNHSD